MATSLGIPEPSVSLYLLSEWTAHSSWSLYSSAAPLSPATWPDAVDKIVMGDALVVAFEEPAWPARMRVTGSRTLVSAAEKVQQAVAGVQRAAEGVRRAVVVVAWNARDMAQDSWLYKLWAWIVGVWLAVYAFCRGGREESLPVYQPLSSVEK